MARSLGVYVYARKVNEGILEEIAQMFMGNHGRLDSASSLFPVSCASCNVSQEKCDTTEEMSVLLEILEDTGQELEMLIDQAMELSPTECKQSAFAIFNGMIEKMVDVLKNCSCSLAKEFNSFFQSNLMRIENCQCIDDLVEIVNEVKGIILDKFN